MRQEMLELIKNEDDISLKSLYNLFKEYKYQRHLDKMIAEGEQDIEAGRIYNLEEVKDFIDSWKVS